MLHDIKLQLINPVTDEFYEMMIFEESAKFLLAFGGTQASKIPTLKVELKRNNKVIIKIS